MFLWGETFAFRDWLSDKSADGAPGGGWWCEDVASTYPNTNDVIGKAWAFDTTRTYDLADVNGSTHASLAEYLTAKMGADVHEYDDDIWADAEPAM